MRKIKFSILQTTVIHLTIIGYCADFFSSILLVIRAIELEEPVKQQRISENIPKWLRKAFREFAGVEGSKIHEDLKNGSLISPVSSAKKIFMRCFINK